MIISVISGKGGTGKTAVVANVGASLASDFGKRVLLVDCNLESPDLSLWFNLFPPIPSREKKVENLKAYIYRPGLDVMPSSSIEGLKGEKLGQILRKSGYHYVILDTPPVGFSEFLNSSDCALITTTPDIAAVSRALKATKMAEKKDVKVIGVVLNRVRVASYEVSKTEILSTFRVPLIVTIPEDTSVMKSLMEGMPCVLSHPGSRASIAFKKLAAEICGEEFKMGPIQRIRLKGWKLWRSV